ncbi:hypothetical protein SELMODRAFT_236489 [Selaginella moellendorffii]|uniref:AB hydrolase-1 domain-containing protein n=1 Tax=Selaginella moellendorffii TaxID=88036 RepID=D8T9J8_SELML|nr:protein ABHD18 [Selaginella moellendorffii]EFJ06660.1 hypothetical protein SELMODRAFT_236489 [Selaginella moellendorffii]|eukprot:XP_002992279.1 protein ABHD18 [Selaginella moellendorffii]
MVVSNLRVAHYWLDHVYGALMYRLRLSPPFFSNGWGGARLVLLEQLTRQLISQGLANFSLKYWPPPPIDPVWRTVWESKAAKLQEGIFPTPCDPLVRECLPPESHIARVRLLMPRSVPAHKMACVVHLAGTGDHGFERRLRLGGPLLKDNIATLVLESPFYGNRRPRLQRGAKLLCVSDLLVLGRATIEEARTLLYWLDKQAGFSKLGVCGLSMGGVHAAMVGSLHPTPLAVLPLLSPHSAAVAFCEGIMKYGTAWEVLMRDEACSMTLDQVRERMRAVLSLTDVTRFPIPKNPRAVIFVGATNDGYIPGNSMLELQRAWPGSEVRWVTGGHVSSFFLHGKVFRQAIRDGVARLS